MNMNQPPLPLAPLTDGLKVAFDIGGVISRYPEHMKLMMYALARGGVKVYIVTDMQLHQAKACLKENGFDFVDENLILSAVWQDHGDYKLKDFVARAGDGWARSQWDERTPIHVGSDKVHLKVKFSRFRADGSVIGRFETIYIVTLQDGHWGIQARSSFAS